MNLIEKNIFGNHFTRPGSFDISYTSYILSWSELQLDKIIDDGVEIYEIKNPQKKYTYKFHNGWNKCSDNEKDLIIKILNRYKGERMDFIVNQDLDNYK